MRESTDSFGGWFVRNIVVHETVLKRFLAGAGLGPADAADLCHDVYVRILESRREPPDCAKALALTIARNLMVDQHRSARSRCLLLVGDTQALDAPDELDPLRRAMSIESLDTLLAAIQVLPARRRQVFLLRRVENRSLKEIAASLGITIKAVEQSLTLALRELRSQVER